MGGILHQNRLYRPLSRSPDDFEDFCKIVPRFMGIQKKVGKNYQNIWRIFDKFLHIDFLLQISAYSEGFGLP